MKINDHHDMILRDFDAAIRELQCVATGNGCRLSPLVGCEVSRLQREKDWLTTRWSGSSSSPGVPSSN